MSKLKRFAISDDITRGITDVINAVHNNVGNFRYEVIALSRLETDPENPRELVLSEKDIKFGINKTDQHYERKKKELEQLESLAHTIKQNGVINPISVYKFGDKYRIIAGERRFLAANIAEKNDIHARIIDSKPTDLDLKLLQWIENNERSDLSLKERLKNIRAIINEFKKTNDESMTADILKKLTGLAKSQAYNYLTVLDGPEDLILNIENGVINNIDKAVLIKNANDSIRGELIVACANGKSINVLKEIITKNKDSLKEKGINNIKRNRNRGRGVQYVHLGKTKNINVIKKIFEIILSQPKYSTYAERFNFDWNDYNQITNGFKELLSVISGINEA